MSDSPILDLEKTTALNLESAAEPSLRADKPGRRNRKANTSQLDLFAQFTFSPKEPSDEQTDDAAASRNRIDEDASGRGDGTDHPHALAEISAQIGASVAGQANADDQPQEHGGPSSRSPDSSGADREAQSGGSENRSVASADGSDGRRGGGSGSVRHPDAPLLLSLEESYDEASGKAKKAAIFDRPTLDRYKPVVSTDTPAEALTVSLNEFGRIDWPRMATLTGKSAQMLQAELGTLVFEDPEAGKWETADSYLSGNVRHKLKVARSAAAMDKKFERNIAALESVQLVDLKPGEISAKLGATWVPTDDIADYVADLIEVSRQAVRVDYLQDVGTWAVTARDWAKAGVGNLTTHGTKRFTAINLIEYALNGQSPTAYDTMNTPEGEKRVVNERDTLEAQEAQDKLKSRFAEWIWQDSERAARLAQIYNEKFNSVLLRTYDGSHLTFPGMNKAILRLGDLDPAQKNAVWRTVQGDNTLLAHCVGAGKTFIMTAAAMEAKRIGLAKKSMFVVPNHLVEQWGAAFLQLYPQANIFVVGKEHFRSGNRQRAMARIATGTYDAVIVSHKSFEMLPVSDALFDAYMQEELDILETSIRELNEDKDNRRVVKILAASKKRLEKKIEDRAKRERKDKTISFEELGIDRVFVDEADLYKNLAFITKMTRVAGLPNSNSNRAADMHIKTRYIREKNNGKGIVFATGTPISNTLAEMYTMQRYLAPEALASAGMSYFDAWAANFGESVTALELAPSGSGYRMNTRFARFVNLPELLTMFRAFADVQTPDMLNLPRPALKGGRNIIVTAPATPQLRLFVDGLVKRAEAIKSGKVDPSEDNMLKITSEGRKAALDMRIVAPMSSDHPQSKVNQAIGRVYDVWERTNDTRSAQLVFCDLSTPHKDRFHVYGAIRAGLVGRGVPHNEIAFIHEADSDAAKLALFSRVNTGAIRVLLGSTEKMGAGTNVQRRLKALHNVDAPWRPRDIEQREGRILRQGNENEEVEIYNYVTESSFDAYMWQTLETKARFIQQIMNGETSVRSAEDINSSPLTYAEIKAIASGNPAVMQKVKVDTEIRKLDSLLTSHKKRRFEMREKIGIAETQLKASRDHIAKVSIDIQTRDANKADEFAMTVAGKDYAGKEGRETGTAALNDLITTWRGDPKPRMLGKIMGFDIVRRDEADGTVSILLRGQAVYAVNYNLENKFGTIMSIEQTLARLEQGALRLESEISRDEKALVEYHVQSEKPFEHEERLAALLAEQAQLNADLDLDKSDKQAVMTADTDSGGEAPTTAVDFDDMTSLEMPERFDHDDPDVRSSATARYLPA